MPKILEKVREQLLAEAERQIAERGYARTTIRSVAGACGIAVGTVYNYFPSKDVLVASFMAQDWQRCAAAASGGDASDAHAYLSRIYDALRAYSERHRALFSDPDAARVFMTVFPAPLCMALIRKAFIPVPPQSDRRDSAPASASARRSSSRG